jgi:hypothetical protein
MSSTDQKARAHSHLTIPEEVRERWVGRLNPALSGSGLLPELIGVIADYAANCLPRWGFLPRSARIRPFGPVDEDGCSRTADVQPHDSRRAAVGSGWHGLRSQQVLSTWPVDTDGRVRWGFLLGPNREKSLISVFGVARAAASLRPAQLGTDEHAWGVTVGPALCRLVHGGLESGVSSSDEGSLPDFPRVVWCTADLRTDTLSYSLQLADGQQPKALILSASIPELGECFAYMAPGGSGTVTLVLPGEPPVVQPTNAYVCRVRSLPPALPPSLCPALPCPASSVVH